MRARRGRDGRYSRKKEERSLPCSVRLLRVSLRSEQREEGSELFRRSRFLSSSPRLETPAPTPHHTHTQPHHTPNPRNQSTGSTPQSTRMGNGAGVEAGAAAGAAGAAGADLSTMPAPEGMVRVRPPKDAKVLKQQFASIFGSSEMKKLVERFTELVNDRGSGNGEASKVYVEPTIPLRAFLQQPEFSCSSLAPLVAAGVLRESNVFEKKKQDVAAALEAAAAEGGAGAGAGQSFGDDGGPMLTEFYCEFGEGKLGLVIKENKTKGFAMIANTKEGSQARNFEQIQKGVRITEVDGTRFPPKGGKKKDVMTKIKAASRPLRIGFAIPKKKAGQKEAVSKTGRNGGERRSERDKGTEKERERERERETEEERNRENPT